MIYDYFKGEDEAGFNPNSLPAQVALAIATSIDALAVGISMACSGYSTVSTLYLPIFIIGIVSFLLSISGYFLGIRFGTAVAKRLKPELLGGLILIAIGIKILLEHLLSI
jgi:putative Mn2+ efflux pump MntP